MGLPKQHQASRCQITTCPSELPSAIQHDTGRVDRNAQAGDDHCRARIIQPRESDERRQRLEYDVETGRDDGALAEAHRRTPRAAGWNERGCDGGEAGYGNGDRRDTNE
jgi:hypothetical protein